MATGALAGAVAMVLALLVAYLASLIGLPYAPSSLGQAIIEVLPGWISVPLIELLEFWAQRLLVVGVLAAFVVAGAAAGIVAVDPRRSGTLVATVTVAPWLATVLGAELFAGQHIDLGGNLIDSAVGLVAFAAMLLFLQETIRTAPGVGAPASEATATVPMPSRRRVLAGAMAVAAVAAASAIALGRGVEATARRATAGVLVAARRLKKTETVVPGEPAFETVERLTPRLTQNVDHYTVDTALIDPRVTPSRWALQIGGAVERPYALSFEELLDLEAVEQLHTLECISNEIGGELVSTALWTGVPLRDLLERAGVKPGAFDIVLRSVDGYSDSIRLDKALDPRTIVAYLMNGAELPEEHGFPARLLVPDIYGMKNIKWLERIEVATHDYQGYWMERGWSDSAIVNTHTRIDVPGRDLRWAGGPLVIAGIANAGQRGIRRVEVSTDGGQTWADATLEPALSPLTWVRWKLEWTPPGTGRHRIVARATDGGGETQTPVRREPFPAGATGYDQMEVNVQRA